MMDDPRHARIRRLVSAGLTPRMVRRVEDDLRRRARALLDTVDRDRVDFLVRDVAAELPMQMICIAPRRAGGRPPLAVRGGRTRLRLPRVAQVVRARSRSGRPRRSA